MTEETRKAIFRSVTVYRKKDIYTVSVVTMSMVAILKISNPKCTTTHAKDHFFEVALLSDQTKHFNFHRYHGNGGHF